MVLLSIANTDCYGIIGRDRSVTHRKSISGRAHAQICFEKNSFENSSDSPENSSAPSHARNAILWYFTRGVYLFIYLLFFKIIPFPPSSTYQYVVFSLNYSARDRTNSVIVRINKNSRRYCQRNDRIDLRCLLRVCYWKHNHRRRISLLPCFPRNSFRDDLFILPFSSLLSSPCSRFAPLTHNWQILEKFFNALIYPAFVSCRCTSRSH